MTKHKGYGKVILFGEHFIVHGLPGIASAISDYTEASIRGANSGGLELIDNRPASPDYKKVKEDEMRKQIAALVSHLNSCRQKDHIVKSGDKFICSAHKDCDQSDKCNICITLTGNLVCASGVGASAALATSIARAFNERLKLGMDDEKINEAAYIAEEAGSGKPSGIDNTCSVFGGFIAFKKNMAGGPNDIERLKSKKPVEIVMGNTGISQETKLVVEDVRKKKEANPGWFDGICKQYNETFLDAVRAVKKGDWPAVGKLMDRNQELLREIGVSCDELEQLIKIAKDNGAIGAKLTGTGRGGYMVALTPGKDVQDKVAAAIEAAGFRTLRTTIGG